MTALRLSTITSSAKEAFATERCIFPSLSARYSILPALISLIADAISGETVPAFGFGIKPFGPRIRPIRPSSPIMSGVATMTSKSNQFSD